VRERIAVLALVALAAACAACSGGSATSAAPSGGAAGGAPAASQVPAICVNVASLRTTVQALTMIDPAAGVNAVRMAANNVATQTATFVSAAPLDLREAARGLKTAVEAVRAAASQAGQSGGSAELTAAIAGVDTAWKDLEAKLAAVCPS
jgi:phage-related protein